ncbi:hypothetical protein B0H63DRAFT_41671 [Podospora didyma]|uniref:Uncharacterized protein n=1 Tax=Podospora didyma TaxID=330526 RepID=A0AAE0U7W7_9PEZI|nr:hypothetical protein B0H63DRAFT_41671 [Podospora didyma]
MCFSNPHRQLWKGLLLGMARSTLYAIALWQTVIIHEWYYLQKERKRKKERKKAGLDNVRPFDCMCVLSTCVLLCFLLFL